MVIVFWILLMALGGLVVWEAAVQLRRRWKKSPGAQAGIDRYYAPEAETRRERDAAASRAVHSAEVGMIRRAEPRRTL